MVPAAYVAEDGFVGHQWEKLPLVLRRLDVPGKCQGQEAEVGGLVSRGKGEELDDFQRGNQERG